MSISEQVKELRMYANEYEKPPYGRAVEKTENVLRNAADTIEALSAKLQAANAERSSAHYENDIFAKIITVLDEKISAQWRIIAGLNDETQIYGFTKSLEAYQQSKLIVEQNIEECKEKQPEMDYGGGWIDFNDNLPSNDQKVLISKNEKTLEDLFEFYFPDVDCEDSEVLGFLEGESASYDGFAVLKGNEDNIAWQPLPEPYRP